MSNAFSLTEALAQAQPAGQLKHLATVTSLPSNASPKFLRDDFEFVWRGSECVVRRSA